MEEAGQSMRALLLSVVCLLVLTSQAMAAPTTWPEMPALLAQMRVPVIPNQQVVIGPCPANPSVAGCNYPGADGVIYLAPGSLYPTVLYHEFGGRFGDVVLDAGAQHRFGTLIRSHAPWPDLAERFEDAYAACAFGIIPHDPWHQSDWPAAYGYEPSAHEHRQVCSLIRKAGARVGLVAPATA
jgi:hypothetical protein